MDPFLTHSVFLIILSVAFIPFGYRVFPLIAGVLLFEFCKRKPVSSRYSNIVSKSTYSHDIKAICFHLPGPILVITG